MLTKSQEYEAQLESKKLKLEQLLSPFYKDPLELFDSEPSHYRMRAEFRVWHEGDDTFHIMFNPETKEKHRVDEFFMASKLINDAMREVMSFIRSDYVLREKLYQIDYLTTLSGQLLVTLIYRKPIEPNWLESAKRLNLQLSKLAETHIIGRARKQKVVLDQDFLIERLNINQNQYTFKQIENSFTQPNAHVNIKMIEWAIAQSKDLNKDLLELYCGAGNFSIPLAKYFDNVLGTEISKTSVSAAQTNITDNQITNLKIAKLSSEEFTQAYLQGREFRRLADIELDKYDFSTILVDPPRAGLDSETESLVSKFDNVIYISCNPESLIQNLSKLCVTHKVKKAALFDQFPFTPHIESGVLLSRI